MLLTRFCRRYRRLIGSSLFVLALTGVGAGVYAMAPPQPRWVRAEAPMGVLDAGDGRLAAFSTENGDACGPLRLLDAATGQEVDQFLTTGEKFRAYHHSEDGRYFIAVTNGADAESSRIRTVDLREQREWHVDVAVGKFKS